VGCWGVFAQGVKLRVEEGKPAGREELKAGGEVGGRAVAPLTPQKIAQAGAEGDSLGEEGLGQAGGAVGAAAGCTGAKHLPSRQC